MFIEKFNQWIVGVNDSLWTYGLVTILLVTGLYFTVLTRAVQVRFFGSMFRLLGEGVKKKEGQLSSFQAFCVSIASRVGTGNIVGIATAIAIGGPGAIFWMWVIALLGMASAFAESVLAQIYKRRDGHRFFGGPAYYIQQGLKAPILGIIFAILISLTFGLIFNMVQANSIALVFKNFHVSPYATGIFLAVITGAAIFGGTSRIAKFSSIIVPTMAVLYFLMTFFVILHHIAELPRIFGLIFKNAFSGEAAVGGILSVVIMQGVKRGLFSNEAGMGSAPNVAASADTSHPVKQGLIQSFAVFSDSMVICTCSALMILMSGLYADHGLIGVELTRESISMQVGSIGNVFLCVAMFIFAYTTIIGNYFYAESNIKFACNRPWLIHFFRVLVVLLVFLGSISGFHLVWNLADFFMALMTITNIYAILRLSPQVYLALKDYEIQRKKNQDPEFHSSVLKKYQFISNSWED